MNQNNWTEMLKLFHKYCAIVNKLNDAIDNIDGLSTTFYFTVETVPNSMCMIKFMGNTVWDSENNDSETSEADIISAIKDDVDDYADLLSGLKEALSKNADDPEGGE